MSVHHLRARAACIALGLSALFVVACDGSGMPTYVPRDAALVHEPLYFYPQSDTARPPRAFVFFYGNDIAFWEPHRKLAVWLARDGFAVVGIDVRKYLDRFPTTIGVRDTAFLSQITPLIARSRHELHADSVPLVLAGHSFGAELAIWQAFHDPPAGLVGILAMNPRPAGHLIVTPEDWLGKIADGPGSFSTVDLMRQLSPDIRVALVRGQRDQYAQYDSEFVLAGGTHLKHFVVPFAGHTLKQIVLAAPIVHGAMGWLVEERPVMAGAGGHP